MSRGEPGLSQIERDMFAPLQPTPPRPRTLHPTLAGRHRQGAVHRQGGGRRASLLHLTYISATSRVYRQKHSPGAQDAQAQTVEKGESATAVRSQHWVPGRRMRCVQAEPRPRGEECSGLRSASRASTPFPSHARAQAEFIKEEMQLTVLKWQGKPIDVQERPSRDLAEISPRSRRHLAEISSAETR